MSLTTIKDALKASREAIFLVELDFQGEKRHYSTAPVNLSGERSFESKVIAPIDVGTNYSLSAMRSADVVVSVILANDERLQDLEAKRYLDAGAGKIYLWADTLTWSNIEDYAIFAGNFRKNNHTLDNFEFDLTDYGQTKGKTIESLSALTDDPGSMIETILLTYTNLMLDEIDMGTIGTMKSLFSAIEFSTQVDDRTDAFNVIDRILSQCCCGRKIRNGKLGVIVFDLDGPIKGKLSDSDLLGRSVRFSATPQELVVNDLYVEYNYSAGSMGSNVTIDFTNNNNCKRSYYDYGPRPQFNLRLGDCADETAARWCAKRFLDFRAFRHDLVECVVPHWVGFECEEGDIYEWTLADGADGWTDECCILLDRTFTLDGIEQRWMRIETD